MHLDSVRELKASELDRLGGVERLSDAFLPGLEARPGDGGLLSAGARVLPRVRAELSVRRLARGVAYKVAPQWSRSRPATRPKLALGIATGAGKTDEYVLAVRVQDPALLKSPIVAGIRERARGEVDVRYIGSAVPLVGGGLAGAWQSGVCRPLVPGASIGAGPRQTTGTLGGFVRPRGGGPVALLSNNHVLADNGRCPPGSTVVQPGWQDGGRDPADFVARLADSVPLERHGTNELDCAIATLEDDVAWEPQSLPGGELLGVAEPALNQAVEKLGRTTGHTIGEVAAMDTGPVTFGYPVGKLVFSGLVEVHNTAIGPFGSTGDSGSLVFTSAERQAVGLLFGVTTTGGRNGAGIAYVNPLPAVLERLDVELLTSAG